MASGLQCPGCGHVHPAGLPEIARGDATFRCYGCYRMLSVPEGWTGRPAHRQPAPVMSPTEDAPPGAGTRDARNARLAGRGRALGGPAAGAPPMDAATQMVPPVAPVGAAPGSRTAPAPEWRATPAARMRPQVGWASPRRSGRPLLPTRIRVPVWLGAFGVGLMVTAFVLRKVGILSVNAVLDLFAGSGLGRFGILLLMVPMWAALSATIAHLSLEALTKRRQQSRPPVSSRPPATTSPPR
jgi:hypothetical protein